jgi:hypothetical protein
VNQSSEAFPKGEYLKTIDVSDYASGVYLVSLEVMTLKKLKN